MSLTPLGERISLKHNQSTPRAWWEIPVVAHIAIPSLPGYLAVIFYFFSWTLKSLPGHQHAVVFSNTLLGWAFVQTLLGLISYPIAVTLAIVLTLAKFRCWATKISWAIVSAGALLWFVVWKITLGGKW
jgi:hypothetical protein